MDIFTILVSFSFNRLIWNPLHKKNSLIGEKLFCKMFRKDIVSIQGQGVLITKVKLYELTLNKYSDCFSCETRNGTSFTTTPDLFLPLITLQNSPQCTVQQILPQLLLTSFPVARICSYYCFKSRPWHYSGNPSLEYLGQLLH